MIAKQRQESDELKLFRCLNLRMTLTAKDANHYLFLEKGFEGEKKFDFMLEALSDDLLIVNDLLLEYNKTIFQIDTLLIFYDNISVFDIKNNEGDYFLEGEDWFTPSGNHMNNPLHQKDRCESLLLRLLQVSGYNSPIESNLVFVNPEFHLYQAPRNLPVIFPSQLNRLMKNLDMKARKLKDCHFELAKKLVSLHLTKSPFTRTPDYSYEQLAKGVSSSDGCRRSFMSVYNNEKLICLECGRIESVESAVLRNIEEFRLLFPDRKLTTNAIYDWCKIISKKTIRRILMKNLIYQGHGKSAHFIFPQ